MLWQRCTFEQARLNFRCSTMQYVSKSNMLAPFTLQVPPIHLWNVALSSDIHSVPSLLMPLLENQLVPAAWQFIKQLSSPIKAMVV